jgi:hypothetical protein
MVPSRFVLEFALAIRLDEDIGSGSEVNWLARALLAAAHAI